MQTSVISQIFADFRKLNVLIVGDVMLDSYFWGEVERISPEAPVPVVHISKKETRLGGAANVALNVKSLGATAFICSVTGTDRAADNFLQLLSKNKISEEGIVKSSKRITTVKNRIICRNHQLLRYDEEISNAINATEETALLKKINRIISVRKIDVVIFQDYNKGVLTKKIIHSVIDICIRKKVPTAVDPKKENFTEYKNVSLFKPNLRELKEGLKMNIDVSNLTSLNKCAEKTEKILRNRISLFTLSEKGMYVHENKTGKIIPAHLRNIADVSGAGDTVISVAALGLALKLDIALMTELANIAGGLVCEEAGVVSVNRNKFLEETKNLLAKY